MEKKLKKKKRNLITFVFFIFYINLFLDLLQPNKFTAFTSFDPEKNY
jgi:hypothetical protein